MLEKNVFHLKVTVSLMNIGCGDAEKQHAMVGVLLGDTTDCCQLLCDTSSCINIM